MRAEVEQERLTSIDRSLLRAADPDRLVRPVGRDAFEQTVQIGRCKKLERLGLAQPDGPGRWRLAPELADTLRRMGERGDIVRTMQRAITANGRATAIAEQVVYEPTAPEARSVIGRVLERGLSDELNDRHYLLVEATDGRTHYVELGRGEHVGAIGNGAVVRVDPVEVGVREVDRSVAAVAAANDGRYSVDAHLRHDPSATEAFAEAHVRRLEAIRRLTGGRSARRTGPGLSRPTISIAPPLTRCPCEGSTGDDPDALAAADREADRRRSRDLARS